MTRECVRALGFVALGLLLYGCALAASPRWDATRPALTWETR